MIKVLHEENDRTEDGNDRSISLGAHAGEVLLKIVTSRIGDYCEVKDLQSEEQYGYPPCRSILDMTFPVRKLRDLERKARVSLFLCFIDFQRTVDSTCCSLARGKTMTIVRRSSI